MIKYYVKKMLCISTLTSIIYMIMYNYGDSDSKQYIFEKEPFKNLKIPPICVVNCTKVRQKGLNFNCS